MCSACGAVSELRPLRAGCSARCGRRGTAPTMAVRLRIGSLLWAHIQHGVPRPMPSTRSRSGHEHRTTLKPSVCGSIPTQPRCVRQPIRLRSSRRAERAEPCPGEIGVLAPGMRRSRSAPVTVLTAPYDGVCDRLAGAQCRKPRLCDTCWRCMKTHRRVSSYAHQIHRECLAATMPALAPLPAPHLITAL